MAQEEEPMDVDSSMCDFDNKENAFQHGNLPPKTPCTEKGHEELDMSELNMKLRYSMTPMSKSYTIDNKTYDKSVDNVGNMTQSLHSSLKTENKPKDLPLHASDHIEGNRVLRPLDSTVTADKDIKITVSTPHETDENISLPSSSSSLAHTPEATTPTKDLPNDGGSPIMRGLKSVLNMFRPSQSPIPVEDGGFKSDVLSPPIVCSPHTTDSNQCVSVSTPLAARDATGMLTKRTSSNKETVVFNEDLEKELEWKDDSTIYFGDERVPFHKLLLQNAKPVAAPKLTNSNQNEQKLVNLHVDEIKKAPETRLDSSVEYMDISYNQTATEKTMQAALNNSETHIESDSEFVDCETTFNKNESLFSAETSLDNVEFLDSTKDIVAKLSAVMGDDTVNISTNTLEASNRSADLSNASAITTHAKGGNSFSTMNDTKENLNMNEDQKVKIPQEEVELNTNQDNQMSPEVVTTEESSQRSFNNLEQAIVESVPSHVSLTLDDNINDSPIISHPDKHSKSVNVPQPFNVNKSEVSQLHQDIPAPAHENNMDSTVVNYLSQIPLIADPRVLLFNISSEMAVEDVQVHSKIVVESIPSEIPLPDDEFASLPPMSDIIADKNTSVQVVRDDNIKVGEIVSNDISVGLCTKYENSSVEKNTNTKVSLAKDDTKADESFAKDVSVESETKPDKEIIICNVEKEDIQTHPIDLLEKIKPASKNEYYELNTATAVTESSAKIVPVKDLETVSTEELANGSKVDNILCTTTTEVAITEDVYPKLISEELVLNEISKIVFESNDAATSSQQYDIKDLDNKMINDAKASPELQDTQTGNNEVISSLENTSDLEIASPKTSSIDESKPLTIDIPQSPKPQNYVAPVTDLIIEGTMQDLHSFCSNVPRNSTREHVIKTVPGSILSKLNDSIEKNKLTESKIENLSVQKVENMNENKASVVVVAESVKINESIETGAGIQSNICDDPIFDTQPYKLDASINEPVQNIESTSMKITETPVAFDASVGQNNMPEHFPEEEVAALQDVLPTTATINIDESECKSDISNFDNKAESDKSYKISALKDEIDNVASEVVSSSLNIEFHRKSFHTDDLANNSVCDNSNSPATDNTFVQVEADTVNTLAQVEVGTVADQVADGVYVPTNNQGYEVSVLDLVSTKSNEPEDVAFGISASPVNKENIDEEIMVSENNSPLILLTAENDVGPEQPTVGINKNQEVSNLEPDSFEKIENRFASSSKQIITPPTSPPIASKGYNFNFDEIDDPFATKTKIRQSPSGDNSPNQTFSHMDDTLPVEEEPKKVNRRISQPPPRKPVRVRANKKNSTFTACSAIDKTKDVQAKINAPSKIYPKENVKLDNRMPESSNVVGDQHLIDEEHHEEKTIELKDVEVSNICLMKSPITSSDNINSKSLEKSSVNFPETLSSDNVTKVIIVETDNPSCTLLSTKTKLQESPCSNFNGTFDKITEVNVIEINDPDFNPMATKTIIQNSPPRTLNDTFDNFTRSALKTDSSNASQTLPINSQKPVSPVPRDLTVEDKVLLDDFNVACISKASTMQSMQTVCSIKTEDEDTIEGPFLDELELKEDDNIIDFDSENRGMFEFDDLPPGNDENAEGEMFIDAEAFEFLLNQNKTTTVTDNGKESLFLKFDPLYMKRLSAAGLSSPLNIHRKDIPTKTPQRNTSYATRLLDCTFDAIPVQELPQQNTPAKSPVPDSTVDSIFTQNNEMSLPVMKSPLRSTFEAIPVQEPSLQNIPIETPLPDSTLNCILIQNNETPLDVINSPLRGINALPHQELKTSPRDVNFINVHSVDDTSKLNQSADADSTLDESTDDLNVTIAKPTMIVNPAVNPIVTPRKSTNQNRRSFTSTSPAIAVIDRLLSNSANNSALSHEHDSLLGPSHDSQANLELIQLRELVAEKELSNQNLRAENNEIRLQLGNLECLIKDCEAIGQERLKNINALNQKLNEKSQENKSMARVVEEYERTIASLITQNEQDKKKHAEEQMQLISERDEAASYLSRTEVSFGDLLSRYEKSKQVIFSLNANEEALKKAVKDFEEQFGKMHSNYENLKQHATAKLNHANDELHKMKLTYEADILKLNTMLKRKEYDATSLEERLARQIKTNTDLTAICDSLLAKLG